MDSLPYDMTRPVTDAEGATEKPVRTYNTEGKRRLTDFLLSHPDCQFTADGLAQKFDEQNAQDGARPIGKSTLYRLLDALCKSGEVRRFRAENQPAWVYQYVGVNKCATHFHLKCLSCGCLIHLDCEVSEGLTRHILDDHGFCVDSGRSILYGVCAACRANDSARKETDV